MQLEQKQEGFRAFQTIQAYGTSRTVLLGHLFARRDALEVGESQSGAGKIKNPWRFVIQEILSVEI